MREYYQTPIWKILRKQVLMSRGYTCEKCGACGKEVGGQATLQVHHKSYDNFGGDESLDDLECLCKDCHREQHNQKK